MCNSSRWSNSKAHFTPTTHLPRTSFMMTAPFLFPSFFFFSFFFCSIMSSSTTYFHIFLSYLYHSNFFTSYYPFACSLFLSFLFIFLSLSLSVPHHFCNFIIPLNNNTTRLKRLLTRCCFSLLLLLCCWMDAYYLYRQY